MNTSLKGVTKTLEQRLCTDAIFPPKTSRPIGNRSLDTLKGQYVDSKSKSYENQYAARDAALAGEPGYILVDGIQLQPVGVIKKGKSYTFVWGNGRLQRIRDFYEEGFHTGNVDVLIIEGVDPSDWATLSLIENNSRSPNPLGDWRTLCELREKEPMITPQEVYRRTGMVPGRFKQLDKQFAKVPKWANNAMLRGEMAPGTAIAIGRVGSDTQVKLKEQFKANGNYLTEKEVKAEQRFITESIMGNIQAKLGIQVKSPRQFFRREEIEAIYELDTWQAMYDALTELLAQTE